MRIQTETGEGELRHICMADQDSACSAEPGDGKRIGVGLRGVGQHKRTTRCWLAGNIKQVFHRNRQTSEWRCRQIGVKFLGGRTRGVVEGTGKCPLPFPCDVGNCVETRVDELAAAKFAGGKPF